MTAAVVAGAAVLISAVGSHAFHSWLRLRDRERISATDRAVLEKRLDDMDRKFLDLKNMMANARH